MYSSAYHEWLADLFDHYCLNKTELRHYTHVLNGIREKLINALQVNQKAQFSLDEFQPLCDVHTSKVEVILDSLNQLELMGIDADDIMNFYTLVSDVIESKVEFFTRRANEESASFPKEIVNSFTDRLFIAEEEGDILPPWELKDFQRSYWDIVANIQKLSFLEQEELSKTFSSFKTRLENPVGIFFFEKYLFECLKESQNVVFELNREKLKNDDSKSLSTYPFPWLYPLHQRILAQSDESEIIAFAELVRCLSNEFDSPQYLRPIRQFALQDNENLDYNFGTYFSPPTNFTLAPNGAQQVILLHDNVAAQQQGQEQENAQQIQPLLNDQQMDIDAPQLSTRQAQEDACYKQTLTRFMTSSIIRKALENGDLKFKTIVQTWEAQLEVWLDYFLPQEHAFRSYYGEFDLLDNLLERQCYHLLHLALHPDYGNIEPNCVNFRGNTLLHSVMSDKNMAFYDIKFLLARDFNLEIQNDLGQTPMELLVEDFAQEPPSRWLCKRLAKIFEIVHEYDDDFLNRENESEKTLLGFMIAECGLLALNMKEFYNLYNLNVPYLFEDNICEFVWEYALRYKNDLFVHTLLTCEDTHKFLDKFDDYEQVLSLANENHCKKTAGVLATRLGKLLTSNVLEQSHPRCSLLFDIRNFDKGNLRKISEVQAPVSQKKKRAREL